MANRTPFRRLSKTKSPLQEPPLRVPGQSADEACDRLLEGLFLWGAIAVYAVVMAASEWWRLYHPGIVTPVPTTFVALMAVAFAAWRWRVSYPAARNLHLARQGERTTADLLAPLRKHGIAVLHDLQGDGFNVDHVVVAPQGIYTVETKTWRKPRGNAEITLRDDGLYAAGRKVDRDPIVQAKAQAAWARRLLRSIADDSGLAIRVIPVVAIHGWWVTPEATARARSEGVWLLNATAFVQYLKSQEPCMERTAVKLCAEKLSAHGRGES